MGKTKYIIKGISINGQDVTGDCKGMEIKEEPELIIDSIIFIVRHNPPLCFKCRGLKAKESHLNEIVGWIIEAYSIDADDITTTEVRYYLEDTPT